MPNLQNLLKRRPVVLELDPEVHARLRARLAQLNEPEVPESEHVDDVTPDAETPGTAALAEPTAEVAEPTLVPPTDPEVAPETGGPASGLDADDRAAAPAPRGGLWVIRDEPESSPIDGSPAPDIADSVPIGTEIERKTNSRRRGRTTQSVNPAAVKAPAVEAPAVLAPAVVAPARPSPTRMPAARAPRSTPALVACPYCAEPLKVPPVASGKCPRCRLRIVVKRVGDRSIYLTEAALPVFLAERRRSVHAGRWTRERDRWLELAMAVGADPASVTRLTRQLVSEDVVAATRNLYMSIVERAARSARRARRWEEASRLRSDQAIALYRIARSARPVPTEVLTVHRDGLASSLRGIAEVARSAELRAAPCCQVCRADDGRTVRIADELRKPTLPHEACEKGLCRCRWYLADRDRAIVSDLLKRQTRPHRQPRSAPGS